MAGFPRYGHILILHFAPLSLLLHFWKWYSLNSNKVVTIVITRLQLCIQLQSGAHNNEEGKGRSANHPRERLKVQNFLTVVALLCLDDVSQRMQNVCVSIVTFLWYWSIIGWSRASNKRTQQSAWITRVWSRVGALNQNNQQWTPSHSRGQSVLCQALIQKFCKGVARDSVHIARTKFLTTPTFVCMHVRMFELLNQSFSTSVDLFVSYYWFSAV